MAVASGTHHLIGTGLVAGGSSAINQTSSFEVLGRVPTLRQRVENQVAPGQEPIVVAVGRASIRSVKQLAAWCWSTARARAVDDQFIRVVDVDPIHGCSVTVRSAGSYIAFLMAMVRPAGPMMR